MSSTGRDTQPDLANIQEVPRSSVGGVKPHGGPITLAEYDPAWPTINLHVFGVGTAEIDRMLRFRDWLRTAESDRDLYARVKRELAARIWQYVQHYADAKSAVVQEILIRANAGAA